jgi:hypothetical protein
MGTRKSRIGHNAQFPGYTEVERDSILRFLETVILGQGAKQRKRARLLTGVENAARETVRYIAYSAQVEEDAHEKRNLRRREIRENLYKPLQRVLDGLRRLSVEARAEVEYPRGLTQKELDALSPTQRDNPVHHRKGWIEVQLEPILNHVRSHSTPLTGRPRADAESLFVRQIATEWRLAMRRWPGITRGSGGYEGKFLELLSIAGIPLGFESQSLVSAARQVLPDLKRFGPVRDLLHGSEVAAQHPIDRKRVSRPRAKTPAPDLPLSK